MLKNGYRCIIESYGFMLHYIVSDILRSTYYISVHVLHVLMFLKVHESMRF